MELLTIRESSLGSYTHALQEAILAGYRMSEESSKYPWIDQQYNAVLELKPFVEIPVDTKVPNEVTVNAIATLEAGQGEHFESVDALMEDLQQTQQSNKPSAGRPRRKA